MRGKSFTAEEDQKISDMILDGFSNPEIAKALGRSTYSVNNRIWKIRNGKLAPRQPLFIER